MRHFSRVMALGKARPCCRRNLVTCQDGAAGLGSRGNRSRRCACAPSVSHSLRRSIFYCKSRFVDRRACSDCQRWRSLSGHKNGNEVFQHPAIDAVLQIRTREGMCMTLMLSTIFDLRGISAWFGLTNHTIDQVQYTILPTAVIGGAVVPLWSRRFGSNHVSSRWRKMLNSARRATLNDNRGQERDLSVPATLALPVGEVNE